MVFHATRSEVLTDVRAGDVARSRRRAEEGHGAWITRNG